ncbi:MAG: hypothetical protein ACFFBP_23405 [Promethearchaeota archaeon]
MKLAKLGNILILLCSGLITVLSLMMLVIMIGLSPALLADTASEYIVPFALALMMPVINWFFAEMYTLIGVMGINSTRYKLIDRIGIGLVVIYIIIISIWFPMVLQAFADAGGSGQQTSAFVITCVLSMALSILTLIGIIIRLVKR